MLNQINASADNITHETLNTLNFYTLNTTNINYGILPTQDFVSVMSSDAYAQSPIGNSFTIETDIDNSVDMYAPSVNWDSTSWGVPISSSSDMSAVAHPLQSLSADVDSTAYMSMRYIQTGDASTRFDIVAQMVTTSGVRKEGGTYLESICHVEDLNRSPVEACVYMHSDSDVYVRDVISFNSVTTNSKASLLPPSVIRKWNNPDLTPVVAITSGGLINPVIYKHSTHIAAAPAIYTDAEVIGRWLFVQSVSSVDPDVVRKRYTGVDNTVITEMTSDGIVIGRWWWSNNHSSMDGGISSIIVNSPWTSTNTAMMKTSGAVLGKLASRVIRDVEMKGASFLYVDGGVKVSENKKCPVFI